MEMNLVASKGLPQDAVLSIKSRSIRSQAMATTGSPFTFPKGSVEPVVKVEVWQTVGTGYLVPTPKQPNQETFKQYHVDLQGDRQGMSCELQLRPALGGASRPGTANTRPGTAPTDPAEMRTYLQKKGVMPALRDALLLVDKEKPEDPYKFLAKHFRSLRDANAIQVLGHTSAGAAIAPAVPGSPAKKVEAAIQNHKAGPPTMFPESPAQKVEESIQQMKSAPPPEQSAGAPPATPPGSPAQKVGESIQQMKSAPPPQQSTGAPAAMPPGSPAQKAQEPIQQMKAAQEQLKAEVPQQQEEEQKVRQIEMIQQAPFQKSEAAPRQEKVMTLQVEARPDAAGASAAVVKEQPKPKEPVMKVSIIKAEGLRNADWSLFSSDKSDPYVICTLLKAGQKPLEICKTQTIDNELNPVWNSPETVVPNFKEGEKLQFEIFDFDKGKKHDFLGRSTLNMSEISSNGFSGALKVEEAGKKINATLTVQVVVA